MLTRTIKPVAKIGFQLSTTNVHEISGYCAAEMAFEEANAKGDLPITLELVLVNDKVIPEVARNAAQEFVDDPLAVGMLGPIFSTMAVTTLDIYNKAGMAQISSEASSPLLTNQGYKNFFRIVANDEVQGRQLAKVAVMYLKAKRIAVLSDNTAWGRPIAQIFFNEAERLGCKPVLLSFFGEKEDKLDFNDLVKTTLDANPDLVYFAVYWNKAHIITHKLRDHGLEAVFLGSDALKPYAFLEVPSLDKVAPYHTLSAIDMRIKPSAREFFKNFAMKYPTLLDAPQSAAEAYDVANMMIEAVRRAGELDRAKVLYEFQNLGVYQGVIGEIRFDDHGDIMNAEIGLYQCKDGMRNYIGPVRELIIE